MLPCVLAFVNGVSKDRIVGFEGLGYSGNSFTAKDLEARLLGVGVLAREKNWGEEIKGTSGRREDKVNDDDDDWD